MTATPLTPLRFDERHITRYPAELVDRRLCVNLIRDPSNGEVMLDLRVWSRPALSTGELQPTHEAITFRVADFEMFVSATRATIAEHQLPGDTA